VSVEREIENLARRVAREEIARAQVANGDRPWLTVEETAELLKTSPGAIRQRISSGWLAGDTVRDGKRRFIRREAVLRDLDRHSKGG
jgi:excisionase family DNA binding protein